MLLLLSSSTTWASGIELLISRGLFHAGEVKLSARGQWWAVCDRPPGPQSLVPVTVQTKRVRDDYVDNNAEMTGIEVEVKGCERARFLVRGLKLNAQEFKGENIEGGLVATYASKTYTFQVTELGKSGYQLELNGAGLRQTIFKAPQVLNLCENGQFSI